MQQCDETDLLEDVQSYDDVPDIQEKLEKLKALEKTLLERQEQLEDRKQQIRKEHQATHQISITEPDAFNMRHANGKQTLPAYNEQACVDSETHLIVAADTVQDRADFEQFSKQHKAVEENLDKDPERKYTADAGYHNLEQLDYIEEHQVDAVVYDPNPQHRSLKKTTPSVKELLKSGRQLERSDFIYDPQKDTYKCPSGQILNFSKKQNKGDTTKRLYQADNCDGCRLCKQCLPKNNELMAIKLKTTEAKERLNIRKTTVEPVFGNLKENLGFRRFSLRGLENVKSEFKLMAIAHNINKLFKILNIPMESIGELLSSLFARICLRTPTMKLSFCNTLCRGDFIII